MQPNVGRNVDNFRIGAIGRQWISPYDLKVRFRRSLNYTFDLSDYLRGTPALLASGQTGTISANGAVTLGTVATGSRWLLSRITTLDIVNLGGSANVSGIIRARGGSTTLESIASSSASGTDKNACFIFLYNVKESPVVAESGDQFKVIISNFTSNFALYYSFYGYDIAGVLY